MTAISSEIINGVLWVSGNLDRVSDNNFQATLEQYLKSTPASNRVIDMSHVRWMAPSSAKILIQCAQNTQEKDNKLRVLASRHVMQTLNLLGAKTWITIESALTPTTKPGILDPAGVLASTEVAKSVGDTSETSATVAISERVAASDFVAASAGSSSLVSAVSRASGALANSTEELTRGAHLLRVLHPNRRYSFHFSEGEEILGIVRERVGGSWILIETHGTRKILNLDTVQYCEVL
ncbi:MAG: STAS domain-containing protein [Planctomycetota bacterium]